MDWLCYVIEKEDADYPKEYLLYFSMLSSLFTSVLLPVIVVDEIEHLYFKSVELVEVHGGLYPASDAAIVYHQLLDTVMFLGTAGRLNSWWTLPMERALVGIKAKKSGGGKSYHLSTIEKELSQELSFSRETHMILMTVS